MLCIYMFIEIDRHELIYALATNIHTLCKPHYVCIVYMYKYALLRKKGQFSSPCRQ